MLKCIKFTTNDFKFYIPITGWVVAGVGDLKLSNGTADESLTPVLVYSVST